jgi:5'-methylthioadenosine phosphorylase
MAGTLGCIAGEEIYWQWDAGRLPGEALGPRDTPFGPSGDLFRIETSGSPILLLPRHGGGMDRPAPCLVNDRANVYALKDAGVDHILGWGPGGAITHNIAVGDLVVLGDLMDQTTRREPTFFKDNPLGMLRQFPVFCSTLRNLVVDILQEMRLVHHATGVAAVREGPRMDTPAEIRMLSTLGAEVVTRTFVPELFLARELEMGYVAVCYVTHYAETGSRHRPFAPGGLFGPVNQETEADRLDAVVGTLGRIATQLAEAIDRTDLSLCPCCSSQRHHVAEHNLPADWRAWFEHR